MKITLIMASLRKIYLILLLTYECIDESTNYFLEINKNRIRRLFANGMGSLNVGEIKKKSKSTRIQYIEVLGYHFGVTTLSVTEEKIFIMVEIYGVQFRTA